jgi:type IV pilus assembly protein PilC
MKFYFKAQKASGEIFDGERDSADKFALFDEIKKEGATMLFAEPKAGKKSFFDFKSFFTKISIGSVPLHEKITFAKNLGAMIEAGLPLSRALSVIERQIRNPGMKKILPEINESIKKGMPLSDSMAKFPHVFSTLFISIVKSGEESGNLAESLKIITNQLERIYFIQRKLRGALMYPALIISLIIVVGILMFIFVVPKLTAMFTELNTTLPLSTRILMNTSTFIRDHYILVVLGIVAIVIAVTSAYKTKPGRSFFDMMFIKFPLVGSMVSEMNTARAGRTLSSLLSSGVNVVEAINITSEVVQNVHFKDVLYKARDAIQKGATLSSVFAENTKIYPPFFAEMVSAGEETGNLSKMLLDVGIFYENEVDQKTKDFSTIIEPLIMVVIGGAVGFFAIAMLTPMYSMMGSIQ